jgi:hypothetical protein
VGVKAEVRHVDVADGLAARISTAALVMSLVEDGLIGLAVF